MHFVDPSTAPLRDPDDPMMWLGNTPMLNLEDDKLRLRVKTVLQFSHIDAERRMRIAEYVSSIPFNVPAFASMKRSRTTLAMRQAVGWYSKAALFMAMLRTAHFPARVRMLRVPPELFRGLVDTQHQVKLPVVEVWTGTHWVATDSYLYDPLYLAAAREALEHQGWPMGYGMHLHGLTSWNGKDEALVMILPTRTPSSNVPLEFADIYNDPHGYVESLLSKGFFKGLWTMTRNRMLSIRMNRNVRELRRNAGG